MLRQTLEHFIEDTINDFLNINEWQWEFILQLLWMLIICIPIITILLILNQMDFALMLFGGFIFAIIWKGFDR